MAVYLLPIEPFEERYTSDWLRWWQADLRSARLEVRLVMGSGGDAERTGGEWLDPTNTWVWKGSQVAELARQWADIEDGDTVLALDGWGPATSAALYMRATTGKKVKVVGFFHAGCWDPHDYLPRVGCSPWGLHLERGWAHGCDLLLAGSEFAAGLIRAHLTPQARVAVVGCPVKQAELERWWRPWNKREPLVLFPHRLAPEKGLEQWEAIVRGYEARWPGEADFVRTRDVYTDKDSLYELMGRARVVVSCARQETFGIVMQEGAALGAHPLWPRRLSYPEVMRGAGQGYESVSEAVQKLRDLLHSYEPAQWDGYHERAIFRAAEQIKGLDAT